MIYNLLIIGNGFDLHCGLDSGFKDYFFYRIKNKPIFKTIYERIQTKTSHKNLITIKDININSINDIKLTVWDLYFMNKISKDNNILWSRIEKLIKESLIDNFQSYWEITFSKAQSFIDDIFKEFNSTGDRTDIVYLLYIKHQEKFTSLCENIDLFYEVLIDELKEFELGFSMYLELVNNDKYLSNRLKLTSFLTMNNPTRILSFNYTDFLPKNVMYPIEYVHGSTKNELIIGIDSLEIPPYKKEYLFTKVNRKVTRFYDNSEKEKHTLTVLEGDINNIFFYGHSLDDQDYSYFQSIFDYYDIINKPIKLTFYYTIFNDNISEIKKINRQSVINLLSRYASTDKANSIKAQNFIHRLLLESRLVIKEIPYKFDDMIIS